MAEKKSKVSELHAAARKRLQEFLLASVGETGEGLPPDVRTAIDTVINCRRKTYRYMLFVGLLVAVTDRRFHPRCLQLKARERLAEIGKEAFDARSLCKQIVVPFEKDMLKGCIGASCDPYVSNPARLPMVEPGNDVKSAYDRQLLGQLYDVLEFANGADDFQRRKMFAFAYALVQRRQATESTLLDFGSADCSNVTEGDFFDFLESHTQGVSAVVILAACLKRKNVGVERIKVHPVTESGASPKEVGDIDLKMKDGRVVAVEVKDKPYRDCDVDHACDKALRAGVHHVVFAIGPAAEKNRPQDGMLRNYWMEKGVRLTFLSITHELAFALFVAGEQHYGEFVADMGESLVGMNAPDDVMELFKKTFQKETT